MKKLMLIVLLYFLLINVASAFIVYLRPPRMILRMNVTPGRKSIVKTYLEIKNYNNVSMNVDLSVSGNISEIISLSRNSLTLNPNETVLINLTVMPRKSGVYDGEVLARYSVENATPAFLSSRITVIVNEVTDPGKITLIVTFIVLSLVITVLSRLLKSKMFLISVFLILVPTALTKDLNVGLIVKDMNSLSQEYEGNIFRILINMGCNVTLIDSSFNGDYHTFDLIVVAGRPGNVYGHEHLDSFVAELPVDDVPTVAIDYVYPDDWCWVSDDGISTLYSSSKHRIKILDDSTYVTEGFNVGDEVTVYTVAEETLIVVKRGSTQLRIVASVSDGSDLGVIALGEPGTELCGGRVLNTRVVFFGVSHSLYWTYNTEELFRNSIRWVTQDSDDDGFFDYEDNCPYKYNPEQEDSDNDGIGDACDLCMNENAMGYDKNSDGCIDDVDNDGIKDNVDNCPYKYNPEQIDANNDGIGDACDLLQNITFDVDNDAIEEYVVDENDHASDGYEKYVDPNENTNALRVNGDAFYDTMSDWLIDVGKDGNYDVYWDPDDNVLTGIVCSNNGCYIDTDNDRRNDVMFFVDEEKLIRIVEYDVDNDGNLEYAIDEDWDRIFDGFRDDDNSSKTLFYVDVDSNGENELIIDTDHDMNPNVYWNPNTGLTSNVSMTDVDFDGYEESLLDIDNDGKPEYYYDDGLKEFIDLSISLLEINPEKIFAGDEAEVSLIVMNNGNYDVFDVKVEFKVNGKVTYKLVNVPKNSSTIVTFLWENCEVGVHELSFRVDPNNAIVERNEGNNVLKEEVIVRGRTGRGRRETTTTTILETGRAYFENVPEELSIGVGKVKTINPRFVNEFNHELKDVKFVVEGVEWYEVYPKSYDIIAPNESVTLSVKLRPKRPGSFSLGLKVMADSDYGKKVVEEGFVVEAKEIEESEEVSMEGKRSPITGLIAAIQTFLPPLVVVSLLISLFIILKKFKPRLGERCKRCSTNPRSYIEVKTTEQEKVKKTKTKDKKKSDDIRKKLIEEMRKRALREDLKLKR